MYTADPFDINYANYTSFTTISVCMFFSPLLPIGLLIGVVDVGLNYLAWKWQFIYRSSIPEEINFIYCEQVIIMFESVFVI